VSYESLLNEAKLLESLDRPAPQFTFRHVSQIYDALMSQQTTSNLSRLQTFQAVSASRVRLVPAAHYVQVFGMNPHNARNGSTTLYRNVATRKGTRL